MSSNPINSTTLEVNGAMSRNDQASPPDLALIVRFSKMPCCLYLMGSSPLMHGLIAINFVRRVIILVRSLWLGEQRLQIWLCCLKLARSVFLTTAYCWCSFTNPRNGWGMVGLCLCGAVCIVAEISRFFLEAVNPQTG